MHTKNLINISLNKNNFNNFFKLCTQINDDTGKNPKDCITIDTNLSNFILEVPDDLDNKWRIELEKFS